MVKDCRGVSVHLVGFFLVLEEFGGGDCEVPEGRARVASNSKEDLTNTEQALEADVLNDNIRNSGVVEEEFVKRGDTSVLDGLRKMTDDQLGDGGVISEGIFDINQEFIDIEPWWQCRAAGFFDQMNLGRLGVVLMETSEEAVDVVHGGGAYDGIHC